MSRRDLTRFRPLGPRRDDAGPDRAGRRGGDAVARRCRAAPQGRGAAPAPPVMRLGDAVKPLAYEAELTIVPTQDRFAGHLVIHVDVAKATDFFWINASHLDIRSATLVAGGKSFVAKPIPGGHDFVGLQFATAVPAGPRGADVRIRRGDRPRSRRRASSSSRTATTGTRSRSSSTPTRGARSRASTSRAGRRRGTCRWSCRPTTVAASNMPIDERGAGRAPPAAGAGAQGRRPPRRSSAPMKRVRFAPTPPLPSYLVAFAVGPFDVVDGGRAGKKGTPLRYLVPKGHAGDIGLREGSHAEACSSSSRTISASRIRTTSSIRSPSRSPSTSARWRTSG